MNNTYKYIGNGMGVPGLPHELTDGQAKELGVEQLLQEAIENGSYIDITESPSTAPRKTRAAAQSEKEINNG